ncbi:MAG: M48 family metallopeptidase [Thermodesulfovibrionales bacterium]|nr:M48 family metallopeptidase [Thermodesulfovibrionales bacterium]
MSAVLISILCLYLLREGFEYVLQYINLVHLKKHGMSVPSELMGTIDETLLQKTREYEAEKTRFSFFSSIFGNIITLAFFFGGILNLYNSWIVSFNLSFVLSGLVFALVLSYANTVFSIPFSLYRTFRIENKYGFNTMTPKLWIVDLAKSLILSTILMSLIIIVGLWLIEASPNFWWIWVWGFFLIFSLFMMYIAPYVIEPLFNKFTPVEEPGLEEKIKDLMGRVDIRVSRVFKMDASRRSTHTNAYFSGIGRVKRIILYDTLLRSMDHTEILAVLAHEAGHWKKKHILKMIVATEIFSFLGVYISFRALQSDFLAQLFMIEHGTFYAKVLVLGLLGGILSFPFIPLSSYISRRFEREADQFACELSSNREAMISTLIKLSKDNLSNLHPHPLYAAFYYSHPPVVERIRQIKKGCR